MTQTTCENQLIDLRRYCAARGWDATEYVDTGISGAKDRRPALDQLMTDARRRTVDTVVVCPTGRLLLGIMGSFAEFERERIRERIHAGLARARRQGQKLGRRRQRIPEADLRGVAGLSVREAAKALGVPASRVYAERTRRVRESLENRL